MTSYSQELAEKIIEGLADHKSLRGVCRDLGLSSVTVLRWLDNPENSDFLEQYTRTRARAYESLAEEIIEISDETTVEASHDGETVVLDLSATAVARNRLRVDTRKWMLAKMLPKKYGDQLTLRGDADAPLVTIVKDFSGNK